MDKGENKLSRFREFLPAMLIVGSPVFAALMTGGSVAGERFVKVAIGLWVHEVIVSVNGAIAVAGASVGGYLVRGPLVVKAVVALACAIAAGVSHRSSAIILEWAMWRF